MTNAAVFGGTTEGRLIAKLLGERGCKVTLFVATDLGEDIAREKGGKFNIHTGRLCLDEMKKELSKGYELIIDATHPYAVEVTKNIKAVSEEINVPLLRLIREDEFFKEAIYIDRIEDLSALNLKGNILFTTGAKETAKLGKINNDSWFIRVLPTDVSVSAAVEQGFKKENIITGKGPFSVEENVDLIREKNISYLITKDSGKRGGLDEKVEASNICNIKTVIIRKPKEQGMTFEEMSDAIRKGII